MTKRTLVYFLHSTFIRLVTLAFLALIFIIIAATILLASPVPTLSVHMLAVFAGVVLVYAIFERAAEEAKERRILELKSQFVMVVHELKSPAAAVRWALSTLLRDTKRFTEDEYSILTRSTESVTRMIHIINEVTAAAKLEEEAQSPHVSKINIVSLLGAVIDNLYLELKQKNIHLSFANEASEDVNVLVDAGEIGLVFSSLIDNAVRYTHDGGKIKICVRKSGSSTIIEVGDSGIGIPAADQKKIFSKFFRATNAVAAEPHGTGLGLYIIQSILERHQGRIWFDSKEGKGTTFYVELPLAKK